MQGTTWYRRVASAGGVFALAFFGCIFVLPIVSLGIGVALAPLGLSAVAALMYFPAFALWTGSLRIGPWGGERWVHDGFHGIPLTVWLITWAVFAAATRNLSKRWQLGIAISAVIVVTIGMHLTLAALGIWLVIDSL